MKKLFMIGIVVLMVVAFLGCASQMTNNERDAESNQKDGNDSLTEQPEYGGTITIGALTEPDSLDAHKSSAAASSNVLGRLGASLVFKNPGTLEYEPYLAESWSVSKDGKTWTFVLNEGFAFHDGTAVTANEFVKTYERAKEFNFLASGNLENVESVEAPDEWTLVLQLREPSALLLNHLSDASWLQPLPSGSVEEKGDDFARSPVGAGPWKFESWENGQSITMVRNEKYKAAPDYYTNRGKVYPDKLVYRFITENQTRLAALDSGSIDIADAVPANEVQKYRDSDEFYVLEQPRRGLGLFIAFNMNHPLLQDIAVRKAINMAVDKEAMVKSVLFDEGEVSYGPLPPSYFGYDPDVEDYGYKYNLEEAKKVLEDAGYEMGQDGVYEKDGERLSFELLSQTQGESWQQSATLIQSMLKQVGIEVDIVSLEWGSLLETATKHDYEMTLMGYTYDDPDVLYLFLHSSQANGGLNMSSLQDDYLDELLEAGRTTIDLDERKEVYVELQKYIVEQAYWAPLWTENQFLVVNNRVQGVHFPPLSGILLQDSWVKQ